MHFKLLIALVEDGLSETLMDAARDKGATGATVIKDATGEGLRVSKTFFGLDLSSQRDVLLFLVEEHLSRPILEHLAAVGEFEQRPGSGIAFAIDVEDAVGVSHQVAQLHELVDSKR